MAHYITEEIEYTEFEIRNFGSLEIVCSTQEEVDAYLAEVEYPEENDYEVEEVDRVRYQTVLDMPHGDYD